MAIETKKMYNFRCNAGGTL